MYTWYHPVTSSCGTWTTKNNFSIASLRSHCQLKRKHAKVAIRQTAEGGKLNVQTPRNSNSRAKLKAEMVHSHAPQPCGLGRTQAWWVRLSRYVSGTHLCWVGVHRYGGGTLLCWDGLRRYGGENLTVEQFEKSENSNNMSLISLRQCTLILFIKTLRTLLRRCDFAVLCCACVFLLFWRLILHRKLQARRHTHTHTTHQFCPKRIGSKQCTHHMLLTLFW